MAPATLTATWPLWLLAALPIVWWLAWRNRARVGRVRLVLATVLRSLVLAAIALALARPALHRTSADVSVVYALDVSASVSPGFVREALDWIAQVDARYRPAQSRFVAFADRARLFDSVAAVRALPLASGDGPALRDDSIQQGATNLEEALLTALPGFAPGHAKRIVLLTDGNQTEGDVWRAMAQARAERVRVFALPAMVAADRDVWVEAIAVPHDVRAGAQSEVEARLVSRLTGPARVELMLGQRLAAVRSVTLVEGENRVKLSLRFPRAGAQVLSVRVSAPGDEVARNDTLTQEIHVRPPAHVLYVEGGAHDSQPLADALTAQGLHVSLAAPAQLSDRPELLTGKDALILSDVRADSLGAQAVRRVQAFVRDDGGGLVFAAGENTYGADGFAGSELEHLLPVNFEAKRKRQDLDLVLLLDRSASMRRGKIEVAKSAALATLDVLEPEQGLAVVAFDAQPHEVVALAPVGDKRHAAERISRITSSGQTNIYSALQTAQRLLSQSQAQIKHIILLSDGLTAPAPGAAGPRIRFLRGDSPWPKGDAPIAAGFQDIMSQIAAAKITLSSVILGEGPDIDFMTKLATWGHGKAYLARSDGEVASLFVGETRRVRGDAIVEQSFRPRLRAWSAALAGVDFATAPELRGFVESRPKRFSEVLLEAPQDLPLLAQSHYGLGRTVVFLSDVKNRWAVDWLAWPAYPKLWAQVVRESARREPGGGLELRVSREQRNAVIELSALAPDGGFRTGLLPTVRVGTPAGAHARVALRQVAPGRYRGQFPLGAAGSVPWRFELEPGPGMPRAEVARVGGRSLFYSFPDEYRLAPANLPLLRTLATQTGGTLAPSPEEIFRPRGDGGVRVTPLWPMCVGLALGLFLLDILVRRAAWPRRRKPRP